eukprot:6468669-Amphidinium_carterae.1
MQIPEDYKCPLCFEIMREDPVLAASSQTYHRECILEWARRSGTGNVTDPLTRGNLGHAPTLNDRLTRNTALRGAIDQFLAQNEVLRARLDMYEQMQRERVRHADKIPPKFVDVLTNSLIWDPVIAEDGKNYDRASISKWFKECAERGVPLVSPILKTPMGNHLYDDVALRRELDEQLARIREEILQQRDDTSDPTGFPELNRIFSTLDDVSDILQQVLEGWTEPRIVTIGAEKVGKSTLLERLCMMPLFGAQVNQETKLAEHTRMPVEVRIKRSKAQLAPVLQVFDTSRCFA